VRNKVSLKTVQFRLEIGWFREMYIFETVVVVCCECSYPKL